MTQYAHLNRGVTPNLVDGFYDTDAFDYGSNLPGTDLFELSSDDWDIRMTHHRWTIVSGSLVEVPLDTDVANRLAADIELRTRIGNGITITYTGNSAINAVYGLTDDIVAEIGVVARDYAASLGMPAAITSCIYEDLSGANHAFTPTQMVDFYKAIRDMRYLLQVQHDIMAAGGTPDWPTQSATIA